MSDNRPNEQRLEQLREAAWTKGAVTGRGVDVAGGPIPKKLPPGRASAIRQETHSSNRRTGEPGYYGQPVVKPPVWTWEIPIYFFVGGIAGMSAVIGAAALAFHHVDLARAAMWVAAIGVVISPVLLILDLGRPRLFINMLRVFKPQSAMSMGVWILTFFGACVVPGLLALEFHHVLAFFGAIDQIIRFAAALLICASAVFGALLATYTGVLIGATAIPAWFLHRLLLPIHFGTAGLGSAAATLELLGHRVAPLNAIGFFAAAIETGLLIWLTLDRHGAADRALHHGNSGWLIRGGEILTGPLALILRLANLIPLAAISFLLGSLLSRFGWMVAGKVSGSDPEAVFESQL
jgi:Polysulphide reductase, NrfD